MDPSVERRLDRGRLAPPHSAPPVDETRAPSTIQPAARPLAGAYAAHRGAPAPKSGKLKVVFDHQTFSMHLRGGVPKSFTEIARVMPQIDPSVDLRIAARVSVNSHLRDSTHWRGLTLPARRPFVKVALTANRMLGRPMLLDADVVHCTYYNAFDRERLPNRPICSSIHDFVPELMPHLFTRFGNPHLGKAEFIACSDLLICVSNVALNDLTRFHPQARAKAVVVPHFVDPQYPRSALELPGLPERFALFVGVRGGYKNFDAVLHAMQIWRKSDPSLALVVAGDAPDADERAALQAMGLAGRTHFISPNDRELAYVYGRAACFVFPSLAEGFGITTLEAMSAGCPVVLSRTPIFEEVGADAALYFDPHDPQELAARVLEASHPNDRPMRSALSLQRALEFTPQQTLPKLVAAWRGLV